MKLADAKLLFDIAIRLQVFTEGVKVTEARLFDGVLLEVQDEFRKLLNRVNYETLDSLTKKELTVLIVKLRQSQSKIYSRFLKDYIDRLQLFMQASLKVNRISYVYASKQLEQDEDDEETELPTDEQANNHLAAFATFSFLFGAAAIAGSGKGLWPKIVNAPIPATGDLLVPYLTRWAGATQVNIENSLRKAYANGLTPQQAIAEATKVFNRAAAQGTAVSNTAMQHVAKMVSAGITSGMFGRYQWLSVIDSSTTDICLSRNLNIYVYGEGPLPPAHTGCRSSIMPLGKGAGAEKESFYMWAKRQPVDIQNSALGKKVADLLRSDKLQAKDVTKLTDPKPMTIDEFADSAKRIVGK